MSHLRNIRLIINSGILSSLNQQAVNGITNKTEHQWVISIAMPGNGKFSVFICHGTMLRSAPININERQGYWLLAVVEFRDNTMYSLPLGRY